MRSIRFSLVPILLLIFVSSCKKDYVYQLQNAIVQQPGSNKTRVKTTAEFISIAYADLYNATVPSDTLVTIQQAYDAFGDKKLIEDMIVRHFLASPSASIPTNTTMRADVPTFVDETVGKLFNRKPDAFENYYISNIIKSDATITPALVYYALMTSDEYRYY